MKTLEACQDFNLEFYASQNARNFDKLKAKFI